MKNYPLNRLTDWSRTGCRELSLSQTPYSFTYAGNYNSGLNNQGSNGNYWSRSAYTSADNAYNLNFNSSNVNPQNNNNKYNGFSVRCVYSG